MRCNSRRADVRPNAVTLNRLCLVCVSDVGAVGARETVDRDREQVDASTRRSCRGNPAERDHRVPAHNSCVFAVHPGLWHRGQHSR